MTEQELKKLRRTDLLEILVDLSRENESLRAKLDKAHSQLASRMIAIDNVGSLAEASLQLNSVFEAAQAACEQYTLNIQQRVAQQEEICARMERETREKCDRMIAEAQQQADAYRAEAEQAVQGMVDSYSWLTKVLK